MPLPRRTLLAGTASLALPALAPRLAEAAGQKTLRLTSRVIEVAGKPATRYGVFQPSGAWGLTLDEGDRFDVRLENTLDVLSGLHWHGLNPPWRQDGVPYISAPPIAASSVWARATSLWPRMAHSTPASILISRRSFSKPQARS